mgnify:CR=1 FL=1
MEKKKYHYRNLEIMGNTMLTNGFTEAKLYNVTNQQTAVLSISENNVMSFVPEVGAFPFELEISQKKVFSQEQIAAFLREKGKEFETLKISKGELEVFIEEIIYELNEQK